MNKNDFEKLKVGTKIQHWAGGPIYEVTSNDHGKIVAVQFADISIVGKDKHNEHYPWGIVESE